uniref:EG45-like domain containing protein 1 isoform X2 n=1 Tax=Nicotiana tabacum TaxID=4097 RepID=A0A1S3Y008_TOBAC|nr:PREDICTED: putative EG45-like domain containing protein 1 isoform X2 [Nicotiana tabacum]
MHEASCGHVGWGKDCTLIKGCNVGCLNISGLIPRLKLLSSTECYGSDATQFPSSNFFAAAGEGIWDNGAACGRQYLISCINSVLPRACKHVETIQIKIVDRAQTALSKPTKEGTTMVLSNAALTAIADPNAPSLNIDFRQV